MFLLNIQLKKLYSYNINIYNYNIINNYYTSKYIYIEIYNILENYIIILKI